MKCVLTVCLLLSGITLPLHAQMDSQIELTAKASQVAPTLLPQEVEVHKKSDCDRASGYFTFSETIDATGNASSLALIDASDSRLADFATEIVRAQKYKPAQIDGVNAAASVELTVSLHACAWRVKHSDAGNLYKFTLNAHPLFSLKVAAPQDKHLDLSTKPDEHIAVEPMSARISRPVPTHMEDPKIPFSGSLMKKGRIVVSAIIDGNGTPQNLKVVRGLNPELDANALTAVKKWHFKPALQDGRVPVNVECTFVATFMNYENKPVSYIVFGIESAATVLAKVDSDDKSPQRVTPLNLADVKLRYMPQSRVAGTVLVLFMIDTDGKPQLVRVVKGLESGANEEVLAMIEHARFQPVLDANEKPTNVWVLMPMHFRGQSERLSWTDVLKECFAIAAFGLL